MLKRCMGCMETYGDEYDICPHCGYVRGTAADEAVHMQPGTLLHERYIIGRVLGFGGFGVTYLGWDGRLEQKVAIKEYLPAEFSTRMPGQTMVTVFEGDKGEQFRDGLDKFVEEAKRLAKFKNESGIVKIFDSFKENDTAYIVMEYLEGETLTQKLEREQCIPEKEALELIKPLFPSLKKVHAEGIIHRDIAPDNIFLTKTGEVKLIDFGASRFATTAHSRSLTVIIKPGYSPEEQYRSRGQQGPHTDVYALAAVIYKMMTGTTPPDAMERWAKIETQKKDMLVAPRKINKSISRISENALLNAMNVRIEDRTVDINAFEQEIFADFPVARRYGNIKKIDLYTWPLWLKILVPGLAVMACALIVLFATGVINFKSLFSSEVVVPDKMVIVPDVEGMVKDEAIKRLEALQVKASTAGNVESDYIEAGKVVLQSPNSASYVYEYGIVYLTISSGKTIKKAENGVSRVPYIIWDTQEVAVTKLLTAGMSEPEIIERYDDNVEAGKVIEQSVLYDSEVQEGTRITIVVSRGPESFVMPNVKNIKEEEAIQILEDLGLKVVITRKSSKDVLAGNVAKQSISAGEDVKPGDEITLTVSNGKKEKDSADDINQEKDGNDDNEKAGNDSEQHIHSYASTVTEKALCGTDGLRTYTCSCGDSYTEVIPATGKHSYISEIIEEPAIGKEGMKKYTCLVCSRTYTEQMPALTGNLSDKNIENQPGTEKHVHNYVATVTKQETCGASGERTYRCLCGANYSETIPATGQHNYSYVITKQATCALSGEKVYTCSCGDTYKEIINPTGQHYYTSVVTVEPEIGKTGIRTYTCKDCNKQYTEIIDALPGETSGNVSGHVHQYTYVVIKEPTCGFEGETKYSCSCGDSFIKYEPPTYAHSYSYEVIVAPTAGKSGIGKYTCSVCGDSYMETISTAAHEHNYISSVIKAASCGSDGEIKYSCSCGDTYTETVLATGKHTYTSSVSREATCAKAGEIKYTCSVCGNSYTEETEATGRHVYASSVSIEATCDKTGEIKYTCSVCGNSYTESIPATGKHTYVSKIVTEPGINKAGLKRYTCSVCGASYDESITALTLSDWTEADKVPSGASIVEQKWVYSKKETMESGKSSEAGWEKTGETWKKTGDGSVVYASFPGGYSTDNWYYQNYAKGPVEAYDNGNTKREVTNSFYRYIYWHWMYNVSYANTTVRAISPRSGNYDQYGKSSGSALGYYYFYAFDSTANCPYLDNYYCCSNNLPSYNCAGYIPDTSVLGVGTPRFFRFETYTSYYTDYEKVYSYQKITSGIESSTEVKVGGNITSVKKYVKYAR